MDRNISELNASNFNDFIKEGTVAIDFWADWCGPCKIIGPTFEEVAGEFKGKAKFGKVNVDKNYELAQRFHIMSIPTMLFFKNGRQTNRAVGVIPKEELIAKIKSS